VNDLFNRRALIWGFLVHRSINLLRFPSMAICFFILTLGEV
jgi:hypothetical protein